MPRGIRVSSAFAQRVVLALLGALLLGARCTPPETNIQAIRRLEPEGTAIRAGLVEIANALPPPGKLGDLPPAPSLSPPLTLDFRNQIFSGDVLMESHLRDPDAEVGHDLLLSPQLLYCLRWTGPNNPLDRKEWNKRGRIGKDCERAFLVPWLVVVRTVAYDLPERLELEVFVADLSTHRILGGFPIALEGEYKKADMGRGRWAAGAMQELRSDSWTVARCTLAKKLRALPGARVDLTDPGPKASDPCVTLPQSFHAVEPSRGKRHEPRR